MKPLSLLALLASFAWPLSAVPPEVPATGPTFVVAPPYPRRAAYARLHGQQVLDLHVGRDGTVNDVKVIPGINRLLDASTVRALCLWQFSPDSATSTFRVTVRFVLDTVYLDCRPPTHDEPDAVSVSYTPPGDFVVTRQIMVLSGNTPCPP